MFPADVVAKLFELRPGLAELEADLTRDLHQELMRPLGIQAGSVEVEISKGERLRLIESVIQNEFCEQRGLSQPAASHDHYEIWAFLPDYGAAFSGRETNDRFPS